MKQKNLRDNEGLDYCCVISLLCWDIHFTPGFWDMFTFQYQTLQDSEVAVASHSFNHMYVCATYSASQCIHCVYACVCVCVSRVLVRDSVPDSH